MRNIINQLNESFPNTSALLIPAQNQDFSPLDSLDLPNDYFEIYDIINGEVADSDGVFGLNRMLTLEESIDGIVDNPDDLTCYSMDNVSAVVFVPIFQSPGRQQLGYAKLDDVWIFCEYDIGVEPWDQPALSDFMHEFHSQLISDGFIEDEELRGLIATNNL